VLSTLSKFSTSIKTAIQKYVIAPNVTQQNPMEALVMIYEISTKFARVIYKIFAERDGKLVAKYLKNIGMKWNGTVTPFFVTL
jgi:hypothetical protein